MKTRIIISLVLFFSSLIIAQTKIIHKGNEYYFADQVIVKYKSSGIVLNKATKTLFSKLNITSSRTFKHFESNQKISGGLDRIYTLKFTSPYNPIFVVKEISKLENIEWVEPRYLYEVTFEPNDPKYIDATLMHLPLIQAEKAWDINKGSPDVIIAIVDTGVDWDHPDLAGNIWINPGEIKNNNIDDDGNGFVDDYHGWDFGGQSGTPDNNPNEDNADHGTHVAGLASASTNNGIGVASIGYNSKIMAVKTAQNDLRSDQGTALIAFGYEGIKYAADNGAKIINCSWGGYSYSSFSQGVIDYASSKGALVVAAAGNDNSSDNFYPASYLGVLSVCATNFNDNRASWSNYGTSVDVSAPGVEIFSTWFNDSYASTSGTSMSSPITAGLAALVTNQFPNYTPLQVSEQIRVNTDNIDTINLGFINQLGSGRINSFKALSNNTSKSVRITHFQIIEIGNNDGIYESGESLKLVLELTNYLNPVSNLNVTLSSTDNNVEIIKAGGSIGPMNTLQKIQSSADLFEVFVKPTSLSDVDVNLLVSLSDVNYSDFDWITISINPTYQIHTTENLSITFNSKGSIGFDDYPTNLKGKGLIFKEGPNLLFEGALVYGTSANSIVNTARDADGNKDEDFSVVTPILLNSPGTFADKETYTKFNDVQASPKSLGIETEVYTYSFDNVIDANYMFIRYVFKNTTTTSIQNFYTGQYWDFDLDDTSFDDDMVRYNTENNFGYTFDDNGDPITTYVGFSLLSEGSMGFFAMDNVGELNPTISWDGFTDEEKWTALSSGLTYPSSGPNDISLMISGGPYSLEPKIKTEIDFLVAAGDNFEDLQNTILRAKAKYLELPTDINDEKKIISTFNLGQNYPNPFNPSTTIKYRIPSRTVMLNSFQHLKDGEIPKHISTSSVSVRDDNMNVSVKVYDILGREVATLVNEKQKPGNYEVTWDASNQPSGVYFYKLKTKNYLSVKKMLLLK